VESITGKRGLSEPLSNPSMVRIWIFGKRIVPVNEIINWKCTGADAKRYMSCASTGPVRRSLGIHRIEISLSEFFHKTKLLMLCPVDSPTCKEQAVTGRQ
jgi:hypothetical protein